MQLFLESAVEVERAQVEAAGVEVRWAADAPLAILAELRRRGDPVVAAARVQAVAAQARAQRLAIADGTALVDRLLMHKLPLELDAIRSAARLADDAYRVFLLAATEGTPQYGIVAEVEAFLRAHGSADNFMLIGSGGPDVRGMTPPSDRRLARGDLVTTELTPEVGGYYAQICRTLVVGKASDVQRRAFAVYHEALEAGDCGGEARRQGVGRGAPPRTRCFRKYDLGVYTTSEYTRVRGHGVGLFPDGKPHILEDVDVELVPGMAIVVHPNTLSPRRRLHRPRRHGRR